MEKEKNYLICIDSDGCAMDTMNIKHIQCFGPCMIEEWKLKQWQEDILKYWNDINLYTKTRGINRFKGLALSLDYIDQKYLRVEGLTPFKQWAEHSPELSEAVLKREMENSDSVCMRKALSWSRAVNKKIKELHDDEKLPFEGVKDVLETAREKADIVIVSSANRQAVEDEWAYHKLLSSVTKIMAQDSGSKKHCIEILIQEGYDPKNVVMIGDAPGDCDAAQKNGVSFYPICVGHEKESWREFKDIALERFLDHTYEGEYQEQLLNRFWTNLE